VLGLLLVTGREGVARDVESGRQLIEAAAAAGERTAQRLAALGYLTGEFGRLDPLKGAS
jgi:hypothetical protein